jgi:aminodeoxyfutalosine deaminase
MAGGLADETVPRKTGSMTVSAEFIAGLPKAELHVHHVGSASTQIVSELAARHPGVVPSDPNELAHYFTFNDFAHFVTVYLSVVDLIRDGDDVQTLTYQVATEMAGQNIRYAELTVSPYTSVRRGIPVEEFIAAIEDARIAAERDHGIVLRWIFDIPGELGLEGAEGTLSIALRHGPSTLVGFGLGGPEIGVPRPQFKPYFDRARAAGLHSVPHAGETTGPQTIWDAIQLLGAERIGHGTSAAEDQSLLTHLASNGIPVEVSPTSNIATGAVADIERHPLIAMVNAGVTVSINSDDPPMFGTTLNAEYAIAARLLSMDRRGVADLAKAGVGASFLDAAAKSVLNQEIEDYVRRQPAQEM